mmetsp:Transcript_136736/g.354543  ORF Transcript_136736/g.354543 Transcript_136736/m.354543 type:complete len:233 (+) Transcript_136736:388-1086(+)
MSKASRVPGAGRFRGDCCGNSTSASLSFASAFATGRNASMPSIGAKALSVAAAAASATAASLAPPSCFNFLLLRDFFGVRPVSVAPMSSKKSSPMARAAAARASTASASSSSPRGRPAKSASLVIVAGSSDEASNSNASAAAAAAAVRPFSAPEPARNCLCKDLPRGPSTEAAKRRSSGTKGVVSNLAASTARNVSRSPSSAAGCATVSAPRAARQRATNRIEWRRLTRSQR